MTARLGPLHEREFRLLFAGRTISMAGSAMAPVALAFAVLGLTGSNTDLGIVLAARQLPVILFLLIGGVIADRLPRHRVMVLSNLVSGASQAVVAALILTGHARIWEIAVLASVNGTASAFFFPASSGIVPQTVPIGLLQQANAALRLGLNSTNIIGAAIGGILVAAVGPGWAIAVDAASYGLAAAASPRCTSRPACASRAARGARVARGLARLLVARVAVGDRAAVRRRERVPERGDTGARARRRQARPRRPGCMGRRPHRHVRRLRDVAGS